LNRFALIAFLVWSSFMLKHRATWCRAVLSFTTRYSSGILASQARSTKLGVGIGSLFLHSSSSAHSVFLWRIPAINRMWLSFRCDSATRHLRTFDRPSWSLQSLFAAPPRSLSDAEIAHLLSLAQLEVPPANMEQLKTHMQRFLSFLETVQAADAGGCSPMHALPCNPVHATVDAQDAASDDAPVDAVLCNSSWQLESMFAVPKAIDD
jgi:aspartyl/glutamyl-tRNA(Asn/Gln) amidotransferase C subunit